MFIFFDKFTKKIAEKFWPGPLTIILKLKDENLKKSLNFKMSNMNMSINITIMKGTKNIANSSWIEQTKFNSYTLPTFTKKIFSSLGKYL